ncbi:DUF5133 domain-containing protein [Streptomyces sp. NPDC046977]|uniref:DUF5133 domain-containing protein n=1 Tax=Streptomyces sp. NPDC046977 TaxID=3154703 RepID=UPI0033C0CF9F
MLVAHPVVLYMLVERYESLCVRPAGEGDGETRRRHREDLAAALCAATGAPTVEAALRAARSLLPRTGGEAGEPLGA